MGTPPSVQPWQALKPQNSNDVPDQHRQILRPQQSSTRREEKGSMPGQNGVQFQPLPSSYVYTKYGYTKYGCSNFPVSTFVSCFWQAFFFVLILLPWTAFFNHSLPPYCMIFMIVWGILPALMLWQGDTRGKPTRIIVWMFSIGSQAVMCILFLTLEGTLAPHFVYWRGAEFYYSCLAFIIAAIVSLLLVSMELLVKKEEFLKKRHEEPEGDFVIEEVVVSSPKINKEEAGLRCPNCGTNAGSEAYYNNCDNICYMTYCTKCVHEHGIYVRLDKDEEKISEKKKDYLETQKLKKEREANKVKEKCKDSVEFSFEGRDRSCANDFNPVSKVLKGRSHYEVLGVEEGCTEEEIRVAFRQLARAVHPDKNRDPRAGEAFSKVQQAFCGLSLEA